MNEDQVKKEGQDVRELLNELFLREKVPGKTAIAVMFSMVMTDFQLRQFLPKEVRALLTEAADKYETAYNDSEMQKVIKAYRSLNEHL